jgi:hypothetical protein
VLYDAACCARCEGCPNTLKPQIDTWRERFGLHHVVLVGDRGMITQVHITEPGLRTPAIQAPCRRSRTAAAIAVRRSPASLFPGERLVVRRNSALAHDRSTFYPEKSSRHWLPLLVPSLFTARFPQHI